MTLISALVKDFTPPRAEYRRTNYLLRIALLCATCCSAEATTLVFTDRGAWNAAVASATTTIDFENIAPLNGSVDYGANGTTIMGVHFQGQSLTFGGTIAV